MSESQSSEEEEVGQSTNERCVVSDPALPHYLHRRAGHKTKHECFSCGNITFRRQRRSFHYFCNICQVYFHRKCHDYPSKMIHPYHPQHPLTFTFINEESDMVIDINLFEYPDHTSNSIPFFDKKFEIISSCSIIFDKCTWCDNNLGKGFYRCQICNFSLDFHCVKQHPPLTIQNPKSHHHSLSLFPRPLSFPCNACGLTNVLEPGYACYQCNYVVHKDCIELPRVIKITRHPHRLSYTPYLPAKVSVCRVCYKNVNVKYGQYSCNHEDCSYVTHSKCGTHENVWDKKELEWEPEELEKAIEPPYKKVGEGLIEHFCHDHHYLKLEKYNNARNSGKQCQACMCSITSNDFYNCIECDYYLHELCANLPRKMDHLLHKHSIFLCPPHQFDYEDLLCVICSQRSSGWKYVCTKDGCHHFSHQFRVDVNCILVKECFSHESHAEHPLFISTTYKYSYDHEILCQVCKVSIVLYHLSCTVCKFVLCFECVTIPNELYYRYDERPLSLCYGESVVDDKYWCELCEKILDPTKWFYTNKELCTTIHLKCLFGDFAYMKAGHTFNYRDRFTYDYKKVEVVGNGSNTRPICYECHQRCAEPVYLKTYNENETEINVCSFYCMTYKPPITY